MVRLNITPRAVKYVRDRVQGLMACNISIYENVGMTLNEETGLTQTVLRNPWYTGKARIWESNTGATAIIGESPITLMQTNISIPFDAGVPKKDHVVVVTSATQDPDLVGRAFRVVAVDGNGQIGAARRMTVTAYTDSDVWER